MKFSLRIDYVRVIREYAPHIYHVQAKDTEILSEGLANSGYDGLLGLEHEDPEWSGSRARVENGFAQARAHLAQFVKAG